MDRARKYFHCTDAERAVFEGGIKLAMVYHQFVGVPVTMASAGSLEKAIVEAVKIQPWVVRASAKIDRAALRGLAGRYRYKTLDGSMLRVEVVTRYGSAEAHCCMHFVREMSYPLMYVKRVRSHVARGDGRASRETPGAGGAVRGAPREWAKR
ncbi:MAG: dihydroneopterin aldolase family protein [Thermoplasmata archaeon]